MASGPCAEMVAAAAEMAVTEMMATGMAEMVAAGMAAAASARGRVGRK